MRRACRRTARARRPRPRSRAPRRRTSRRTAPSRPAPPRASRVVWKARTGWLSTIQSLTLVLDRAQLLRRRARLPCVKSKRSLSGRTAEPAWRTWVPRRRRSAACSRWVAVWLHSVAWRAARSTVEPHALALASARPRSTCTATAWSSPRRKTSVHARRARVGLDDAGVGDLAAALGVEGALANLVNSRTVGALERADAVSISVRLVADEARSGSRRRARTRAPRRDRPRRRARVAAPVRARSRCSSISSWKPASSTDSPCSAQQLARQVVGKAEGVVQLEGVVGVDPRGAAAFAPVDQVAEQLGALLERAAEALLLGRQPLVDRVALGRQLRVGGSPSSRSRRRRTAAGTATRGRSRGPAGSRGA